MRGAPLLAILTSGCIASTSGGTSDVNEVDWTGVLCDWTVKEGNPVFGPTWHEGDFGVDLSESDRVVLDSATCSSPRSTTGSSSCDRSSCAIRRSSSRSISISTPSDERRGDGGPHLVGDVRGLVVVRTNDDYARHASTFHFDLPSTALGLSSHALRSPCGTFYIPINEDKGDKGQIAEYLREDRGPGVQHIALLTSSDESARTRASKRSPRSSRTRLLPRAIERSGAPCAMPTRRASLAALHLGAFDLAHSTFAVLAKRRRARGTCCSPRDALVAFRETLVG